jgi:hypothetical protein
MVNDFSFRDSWGESKAPFEPFSFKDLSEFAPSTFTHRFSMSEKFITTSFIAVVSSSSSSSELSGNFQSETTFKLATITQTFIIRFGVVELLPESVVIVVAVSCE